MTEDKMAGWHHRLKGHEFEQTPGDSEGQGILACCSPWGCKESDTTLQPNNKILDIERAVFLWNKYGSVSSKKVEFAQHHVSCVLYFLVKCK